MAIHIGENFCISQSLRHYAVYKRKPKIFEIGEFEAQWEPCTKPLAGAPQTEVPLPVEKWQKFIPANGVGVCRYRKKKTGTLPPSYNKPDTYLDDYYPEKSDVCPTLFSIWHDIGKTFLQRQKFYKAVGRASGLTEIQVKTVFEFDRAKAKKFSWHENKWQADVNGVKCPVNQTIESLATKGFYSMDNGIYFRTDKSLIIPSNETYPP